MSDTCDVAILGAGSAGLSLAAALAESAIADRLRVTVLEANAGPPPDHCFAFWAMRHELETLSWPLLGRWRYWRFAERAGDQVVHDGGGARWYAVVSALTHRCHCLQCIARQPGFELVTGVAVTTLTSQDQAIEIGGEGFRLRARYVVDTRNHARHDSFAALLYQQFVGHILQLPEPSDAAQQADIMTDMSADEHGFRFVYRLPLPSNRLLVEETRFTPQVLPWSQLEDANRRTVKSLGPTAWLSDERGIIPMGLCATPSLADPRIRLAGTRGGAVRAASGYAFCRIQRWAHLNARRVEQYGLQALAGHPPEPRWRTAMDRLFLKVLRRHPERAPSLFVGLAKNVDGVTLADFLSDRGGLKTAARIIKAMPARLFLETALRGERHG